MDQLPPPYVFGLPEKFNEWRDNQPEACEFMLSEDPRFKIAVCPTGFGKSLTYMTAAMINEGRTIILTSTKGLQTQLINDFGEIPGVTDIRGKGNYPCRLNTKVNCDMGLCAYGMRCSMQDGGGCFYYDQLNKAKRSKVVITNYSYWMAQNDYSDGIGEFTLMILDEAHDAPDHVIDYNSVSFSRSNHYDSKILQLDVDLPNDIVTWRDWADDKLTVAKKEMDYAKETRKEKKFIHMKRMVGKLQKLVDHMDKTWVWEDNDDTVILSPIWPAPYAESTLFMGIPNVTLTSATVVGKTAELLGVKDSCLVREYPHSFPIENRPLIHVPTVRMNWKNGDSENKMWLSRIDQIIRDRIETKGIIHTVSYARRDMVLAYSEYSGNMVTHSKSDTEATVRAFKSMEAPAILVSPSMATGWDFPDAECRWQVIVKLPFPDTRGAIVKARSKDDSDFINYVVMQQLIQATGRGVRHREDYCETFIIDDNITWFLDRNKHLLVEWFKGAYRSRLIVPRPKHTEEN